MGEHHESAPGAPVRAPVGIVGAGTMGIGVAQCFAQAGHRVTVTDPDPAALAAAPGRLRDGIRMSRLLRPAGGSATAAADAPDTPVAPNAPERAPRDPASLVSWSAEPRDLAGADFVVECAREHLEIKETVLRELDRICAPATVVASCTSAISIGLLGSFTDRPDRILGLHFMNPAPLKEAVEVVRSEHTSDETLALALGLLDGMGKRAVLVGDGPGFVSNRVLMLTLNEAAAVVGENTADAAGVDQVFQECLGHPMGPLRTADLIGLDTVVDSLEVLRIQTGDERFRPCALLAGLVAEGHTGRKAGRGFHAYPQPSFAGKGAGRG